LLGDLHRRTTLDRLFATPVPAVVFYTAGYRDVVMLERFLAEAVLQNAVGTARCAEAALEHEDWTLAKPLIATIQTRVEAMIAARTPSVQEDALKIIGEDRVLRAFVRGVRGDTIAAKHWKDLRKALKSRNVRRIATLGQELATMLEAKGLQEAAALPRSLLDHAQSMDMAALRDAYAMLSRIEEL